MTRMIYKRVAKRSIEEAIVTKEVDPSLQAQIDALHVVDTKKLDLIRTMAIGLTEWINKEDESPQANKIEASERILNCYLAQLEEKTDDTAIELDLSQLGLKSLPPEIGKLTNLGISLS